MTPDEAVEKIKKMPHWSNCVCEKCEMARILRKQREKVARRRRRPSTRVPT